MPGSKRGSSLEARAGSMEKPFDADMVKRPLYLPPGRDTDMRKWSKQDVYRWLSCFLKPANYQDFFVTVRKLEIDGDVLLTILERRPSHLTFGIPEGVFEMIIKNADSVQRKHNGEDIGIYIKPEPLDDDGPYF
ncbi:hypothetical protein CRE_07141 [Caenorhabditis remanei]|uniref:SAM domain-containing protein n=1 Tax=Caenorhabditis remanei TaxID=31234 RepID=E3NR05_CAERE|nr:hypothetical protein CRE_07141 [Caenorhabditis remanei]